MIKPSIRHPRRIRLRYIDVPNRRMYPVQATAEAERRLYEQWSGTVDQWAERKITA